MDARGRLHWARAGPTSSRDRLPLRPRRRADPDRQGAQRRLEADLRRRSCEARRAQTANRSCRSTPARTTTTTSTAGRAPTGCAPSSPRGASPCPRAAPDDPPDATPSTASATARTSCCTTDPRRTRVQVYPGSVAYLKAAERAGLRRAVVSASANCTRRARRRPASPISRGARRRASTAPSRTCAGKPAPGHLPRRRRS